jgi:SAM-dependent methyltransferase
MVDIHERIRDWWDADAQVYDGSAGHAMSDPIEAAAWAAALSRFLPQAVGGEGRVGGEENTVLDVGAGTGALSLLAADLGYRVTALDLSEAMLAKARVKAEARGLDLSFVVGRAEEPPPGPFGAVIERHVAWTLPDPVAAMGAWRNVVRPGGRLVLLEGSWAGEGSFVGVKDAVSRSIRRLIGGDDHHHAAYPLEVTASLPLGRVTSAAPFVEAVRAAGWTGVRLQRLPDVEWATERRERWPMGWLERRPRYAVVADAR